MKKKVAIFITSLRGGGAERIVSYLLSEGFERFEFHLVMLENVIDYTIPAEHVKIFILEKKVSSGYVNMLKLKPLAKKLQAYLELNKIDTLLSLLNRPNLISCKVKKNGWKGKVIISERVDPVAYYKTRKLGWLMLRMIKKFYPAADQVTVISAGIADNLRKLGVEKSKVIYNPVHVLNLDEKEKANGTFSYIYVARFDEQKNHKLLLEAFSKLENKSSELLLLGKGKLQAQVEEQAIKLHIKERVKFLGFHKDVNPYLQKSDCFVFSSDFEGLGNVIIEAMNNGLPVISTDCPHGPREIIDPAHIGKVVQNDIDKAEFGLLVPIRRADLLAAAMDMIYNNPEMREHYSKLSLQRVKDFDIRKTMEEYFDLF